MKVLLTLMVRNESKILKRCMEAGSKYADDVLVVDTGSDDTTVEIAKEFGAHVVEHTWKNFGHNRSLSFNAAVKTAKKLGWDLDTSYALVVDADMVLCGSDVRPKLEGHVGYRLTQKHTNMEYQNTRFLRLSSPWKCVGVTHEYWDCGGEVPCLEDLWIDDIGDGGCKADKFPRDIRLLTQGLMDEPNNVRYLFYLAQSYRDSNQLEESIKWYKKRVAAGGWVEEVWYSMYMIASLYNRLGKPEKMELWVQRAYEKHPHRSEALMLACRRFREMGQNFKAWHYLQLAMKNEKPKHDLLFIEPNAYACDPDFEHTVLKYYVSENRDAGMDATIKYVNSSGYPNKQHVITNCIFYTKPLNAKWQRLTFPVPESYVSSSISVNSDWTMNVRCVNYFINPNGSYRFQPDGTIRTRNFKSTWDPESRSWEGFDEVRDPAYLPTNEKESIRGIEDVRLFGSTFTATTREFCQDGRNRMMIGTYPDMTDCKVLESPMGSWCEKNWIPIGDNKVVYSWCPFRVGEVTDTSLKFTHSYETPEWFSHLRGSSTPFLHDGKLWFMTHLVIHSDPRKYLHSWVVVDAETYRPLSFSRPFSFRHWGIEYCAGTQLWNDEIHIFASVWDRESWHGVASLKECVESLIPVSVTESK